MAFCTDCGTELPADARFCPACGKAADTAATASHAPRSQHAAPVPPDARPVTNPSPAPLDTSRHGRGRGAGLILPIMVVVALVVIGIMLWSQREGARPIAGTDRGGVGAQAPDDRAETTGTGESGDPAPATERGAEETTRTTVAGVDAAFRTDPRGAQARYPGALTVSGTVAAATPGNSSSLSLEGRTPFNYVVANVEDGLETGDLARGSRVTLTCDRVTALAGTTILQGCSRD